jgi:multidrug efflux pump subunit AcrB
MWAFVEPTFRFMQSGPEAGDFTALRRFRPIILTSLTYYTAFGLMPMILETNMQAQFLIPMAISLAFGILFATVMTLLLIPSLYLILEDMKKLFRLSPSYTEDKDEAKVD